MTRPVGLAGMIAVAKNMAEMPTAKTAAKVLRAMDCMVKMSFEKAVGELGQAMMVQTMTRPVGLAGTIAVAKKTAEIPSAITAANMRLRRSVVVM